jgi:PAS domain S-box-containing protein
MPPVNLDSRQWLAAIIDSSDDAIISKDLHAIITSWNKGAERLYGYTAEEMMGKPITLLIPEDRQNEEPAILNRIRAGERIDHYHTVRKAKDGRLLDVSLTVSPIRDTEGNIVGASKIARDITAEKRIQDQLRQSEERYRVTLGSIGDAVIATDEKGNISFMNAVAEKLTGWPQAEAAGKPLETVFRIVNEYTRAPVENPVIKVLRMGAVVGLANHTILISREGTERPIDDSGAPIRQPDKGTLNGVVLVFRDVTERRSAELSALRLAAIVEGSEDAIVGKTLDGIITNWNQAAERILGYSATEAIGKPITLLIPPDRLDEEREILARLKAGRRVQHFETVRVTKDGREIDVSLSISPIKDPSGRVVGASKILRDITERKKVDHDLLQAQRQLQQRAGELEIRVRERTAQLQEMIAELESFSYSVSHDLRAPLRAIQQYAEILKEDYQDKLDEEGRKYLTRIAASTARMDALVRDVLTYSRVVRSDIKMKPLNTEKLLRDLIEQYPTFQPPLAQVEIVSPLHCVMGHEPFLIQCLTNLIGNAVKFMPKNRIPQVRVRTEENGDVIRLWVEDNGIGIESEDQERIFGMFEKAAVGQHYDGTGIGLSIVRKAVERMEGRLGVDSEIGRGSQFWIELSKCKLEQPDDTK